MTEVEKILRQIARKLLEEQTVEVVIGYEKGSLPLRTTPCFVSAVKDVDKLVWDATCENNLAKYVTDRKGAVGVIAKSCDARSIAVGIGEKQIMRENVFLIGLPCSGIIDRKKVETALEGKEILEAEIDEGDIVLRGAGFETRLLLANCLDDSCLSCEHRNPPFYDDLVGDKVPEKVGLDNIARASGNEDTSSEQRWTHFTEKLSDCIRCYACRNVCPLCYCEECFVDQSMPRWLGKTDHISETMVYHIVRVLHVAGRCVDCGACSRACPMGIDLRELTQKMVKLVKELYGFEAGLSLDEAPLLATFKQDDPQEFIK